MARPTPLLNLHREGEGLLAPYGPSEAAGTESGALLVEAFDPVEIEYAAIRRHAAIFDQPHRATLVATGADRLEFLNRMLTQELKGAPTNSLTRSFWLNRKGRIDADLRVLVLGDRVLLDLDVHAAARTKSGLETFVISEDVQITDATQSHHRIALHGTGAIEVIQRHASADAAESIKGIPPGQVIAVRIAGADVLVDRQDSAGVVGLELLAPAETVGAVYEALSTPWSARERPGAIAPTTDRARRIGWHALNIARIEAGTALYYADFGPDSLPHETGESTLADRVSFKKGCYLGQEVVARMQSLGHPKQRLCALRVERPALANPQDRFGQAVTGTRVLDADSPTANVVGAVTSSCESPMLGGVPIAFAMLKWSHVAPDTRVFLAADGPRLPATVQEQLRFLE